MLLQRVSARNMLISHLRRKQLSIASHLLHVNSASQKVSGDENAGGARSELAHDDIAGVLVHVAVGGGHSVVTLPHLVSQPVHLQKPQC